MKVMRTEKQQAAIINTDIFYQNPFCVGAINQLINIGAGFNSK